MTEAVSEANEDVTEAPLAANDFVTEGTSGAEKSAFAIHKVVAEAEARTPHSAHPADDMRKRPVLRLHRMHTSL